MSHVSRHQRTRMLSYVCIGTNDLPRAIRFYDAVLATIGAVRFDTSPESDPQGWAGYRRSEPEAMGEPFLWVCTPFNGKLASAGNGTMVALQATSWHQVDALHEAALSMGGASEGLPGMRSNYNVDFYAAYVRDPDGNKLAVVCRGFTNPKEGYAEHLSSGG